MDSETKTDPKDYIVSYEFNCFNCGCNFEVYLGYINTKDKIICPNCGETLPDDVFNYLKQAADNLEKALISLNNKNTHNSGWKLSLRWKHTNQIPKRPEMYDFSEYACKEPYKPFDVDNPNIF